MSDLPERVVPIYVSPRPHIQIRLRVGVVARRCAIAGTLPFLVGAHLERGVEVLGPDLDTADIRGAGDAPAPLEGEGGEAEPVADGPCRVPISSGVVGPIGSRGSWKSSNQTSR